MINFDALPSNNPLGSFIIPKGRYKGTIEEIELKQGKDPAKPPYLNITWVLFNDAGKRVGKLFDIITEPTSEIPQYKLRRFIEALELPITGNFELKDLTKITKGKSCFVDVTVDTKSEPNRSVVDVFSGEVYYPLTTSWDNDDDDESFEMPSTINASDAEDNVVDSAPFNTSTPGHNY